MPKANIKIGDFAAKKPVYEGPLPPGGTYRCVFSGIGEVEKDDYGKPICWHFWFEIAEPEGSAAAQYNRYEFHQRLVATDLRVKYWLDERSRGWPLRLKLVRVGQRLQVATPQPPADHAEPKADEPAKERAKARPTDERADEPTAEAPPKAKGPGFLLGRASDIEPENATWLWDRLIPVGELTLLAGREGVGKSTLAYAVVARVTRGRLPGEFKGTPREVIVVATEDSWGHTIVPRLMAAGADLHKVRPVHVELKDGERELTLLDAHLLEAAINKCCAVMVLFDPLMSRFSGKADTHKDAEVRSELEPLVRVAHDTGCAALGLIHVNKGDSADPLNTVMGSRAFTAVARSVLFVMTDPKDENVKLFAQAKSNLGPKEAGTREFTIETAHVPGKGGAKVETSKLVWGETDKSRSLFDVHKEARSGTRGPTVTERAAEWVRGFLLGEPDYSAPFKEIEAAAEEAGFTRNHLYAALRERLDGRVQSVRASELHGPATWRLIEKTIKLDQPVGPDH
jgi:energy-coupling factor transporter ATP-binding protein EcfA2